MDVQSIEWYYFSGGEGGGGALSNIFFFISADVRLTYLKKAYFVTMGNYQMAILLCFNERDQLKVKDIQEQTQLAGKELIKQIQSLIESKLVSAQQTASEEELNEQSLILLNNDYSNKRTKFKITAAVQKDSPQVFLI